MNDLESEFKRRILLRDPKAYIQRLWDSADIHGLNKGAHGFAQPSDFILTCKGSTFYAEVKGCKGKTSFPFANIQKSQIRACKLQVRAGGIYMFFIFSHEMNQWYIMTGNKFVFKSKIGNKSIKWKDLEPWM